MGAGFVAHLFRGRNKGTAAAPDGAYANSSAFLTAFKSAWGGYNLDESYPSRVAGHLATYPVIASVPIF
jgi:hypothetical protein